MLVSVVPLVQRNVVLHIGVNFARADLHLAQVQSRSGVNVVCVVRREVPCNLIELAIGSAANAIRVWISVFIVSGE